MALEAYRAKRKFARTPEPKGGTAKGGDPIFVIQKHHARRMHYDLRLEMAGTLKSWAVPEGPCLDPKVRRFAKLVEDHPLEYATFEGKIPSGNYGAGTVIVWDRGTWVTLADNPEKAMAEGELKFRLSGEKLSGGWTLVRLPDDPTNWLLIKERDIAARPLAEYDVLKELPDSAITGRPVESPLPDEPALASASARVPPPVASKIEGAREAPFPKKWSPQLAGTYERAPRGDDWLHEIKYDGYRTIAFFDHGDVRLITRNGHDWTKRYSALAKAFEKLPCESGVLDGEVVVQDARGLSSLNLLEDALSKGDSHGLTYFAFDLVYLDGFDLSGVPLVERKRALEGLITPLIDQRSPIQLSTYFEGDGEDLFLRASQMGLEGIVSKKKDARYVQRRADSWVKVKRVDTGKFVVIGYLSSAPKSVTSLILAEEREDGLVYACRAGSGITETMSRELYSAFSKAERGEPVVPVPKTPDAHFVEPNWIADIGYRSRSQELAPRAPVVIDVKPAQTRTAGVALKPRLVGDRELASIELTNPERMMLGSDVTKLDIAIHYARVGDWLLPEMLRRPVTILRCPSGEASDCFYQRHAFHGLPDGVETVDLADEEGRAAFITVTKPKGYLALAQFGAIEFHLWGCHVDDPEHPDRLIIDLDPDESLTWSRVCDGAEVLRARLETMGFHVFLRTTGGKGLHLVMALRPGHDWTLVKSFAESFARAAAKDAPNLFTAISGKQQRKGRIYLDYVRNARGASAVSSYSLRARPGFPVATPITWEELRTLKNGAAFDRVNTLRRIERLARDPWDELGSSAIDITPRMKRDIGMK